MEKVLTKSASNKLHNVRGKTKKLLLVLEKDCKFLVHVSIEIAEDRLTIVEKLILTGNYLLISIFTNESPIRINHSILNSFYLFVDANSRYKLCTLVTFHDASLLFVPPMKFSTTFHENVFIGRFERHREGFPE